MNNYCCHVAASRRYRMSLYSELWRLCTKHKRWRSSYESEPCKLVKEGLYWLEFEIGYSGKTTDVLIAIWWREAEAVLIARHKGGTSIELYKAVAQRKVHVLINAADPEQVDLLSHQLPILQENGINVMVTCAVPRRLLCFTADSIYLINFIL